MTCLPKLGLVSVWTSAAEEPGMPALARAERTWSGLADFLRLAWILVPEVKSIPRFSCLVASETAPTVRMQPERVKNQRLAPLKSKLQRNRCAAAPSARGERMTRVLPSMPRKACVNSTAGTREAL